MPLPSISTLFNVTTKEATITDTFNYGSIIYSSAFGNITAKLGNTIFHQTTGYDSGSDIVIGTNTSKTIDLPVSAGVVKSGSYEITYDLQVNYAYDVNPPATEEFDQINITPASAQFISQIANLLSQFDEVVIQFGAGGNVVGSSVITDAFGTDTIAFETVSIGDYDNIDTILISVVYQTTNVYTFDNCKVVTATLTPDINCASAQITLRDTTVYPSYVTTLTREMTLRYPRLADGTEVETAVTTDQPSLTVGPYIWSGGYLFSLQSVMSWTQSDLLQVSQTAICDVNKDVQCDAALCKVGACMYSLMTRYITAVKTGVGNITELFQQNFIANLYVTNYNIQLGCGNSEKAAQILTDLMTFLSQDGSTECNCGCGDSTNPTVPTKIYPVYGSVS
jgi:hypothetical protein